jgi:hypothetical protein
MKPLLLSLFLFSGYLAMAQTKTVCFKETTDPKDIRKQINYYRNQIKQDTTDEVAYYGTWNLLLPAHGTKERHWSI